MNIPFPSQVSTIMGDYRLDALPTQDQLQNLVIDPIQKLCKVTFQTLASTGNESRTICLQSTDKEKDIFLLIRLYDRNPGTNDKVLLAITLEMRG